MISKAGVNIPLEPLMVYSALPKRETIGRVAMKYINRTTGLKWKDIHKAISWLAEQKFVIISSGQKILFTHSIDALMVDEQLREHGVERPLFVPGEHVTRLALKKEFGFTKEQVIAFGKPDIVREIPRVGGKKSISLFYKIERIVEFMQKNNIKHKMFEDWKDYDPNSQKSLSCESIRLLRDGEIRFRKTIKTKN